MDQAAAEGDIFITATGMKDVIVGRHFRSMKDGAIVCNTGHYDCELNLVQLAQLAGIEVGIGDKKITIVLDLLQLFPRFPGQALQLGGKPGKKAAGGDIVIKKYFFAGAAGEIGAEW